jgi:predicted TIM-barrel fold metal-dependent hydrolase
MRTIALEEHYATPAFIDGPGRWFKDQTLATGNTKLIEYLPHLINQLCDLGHQRITDMDTAGIDLQVLSLTAPGVEQLDPPDAIALARETNDHLAEAVRHHPARLAGFAALPTPAPDTAADELQRAIGTDGFKGVVRR